MTENKSEAKLLSCPFCGGAAKMRTYRTSEDSEGAHVECVNCNAKSDATDDAYVDTLTAVSMWNNRTPSADPNAGLVAALEDAREIIEREAMGGSTHHSFLKEKILPQISEALSTARSAGLPPVDCNLHQKPDGRWGCLRCDTSWDDRPARCIAGSAAETGTTAGTESGTATTGDPSIPMSHMHRFDGETWLCDRCGAYYPDVMRGRGSPCEPVVLRNTMKDGSPVAKPPRNEEAIVQNPPTPTPQGQWPGEEAVLRKFADGYRSGAQGCDMEWDAAQALALAIDKVLATPLPPQGRRVMPKRALIKRIICYVRGHCWNLLPYEDASKGWSFERHKCLRCGAYKRELVAGRWDEGNQAMTQPETDFTEQDDR